VSEARDNPVLPTILIIRELREIVTPFVFGKIGWYDFED